MSYAHDMCHQGYKRTKEKLRLNFFWPDMSKSIREYVDTCLARQKKARAIVKDRVPISVVPRDQVCLLYTSPSPRDRTRSRMPSSA